MSDLIHHRRWALVRGPAVLAAMAGLATVWLAMLLLGAGPVDRALLTALYAGSHPPIVAIALGFTRLGEWPVVIFVSGVAAGWLAYQHKARLALLLLAGSIVGRLLVILQKIELGRLRPAEHLRLVEVSSLSFPSAHAANSMLVYPLCALLIAPERWRRVAVAAAVLLSLCIGASRVLLGVHWPSDVVGGWAFGSFCILALLRIGKVNQYGG